MVLSKDALTDVKNAKEVAKRLFDTYDTGRKGVLDISDFGPMIQTAYKSFNLTFSGSNNHNESYKRVLDVN